MGFGTFRINFQSLVAHLLLGVVVFTHIGHIGHTQPYLLVIGLGFGETTEIGDNCTIYHGVTLGGTGKDTGKRHPTLGNNVLIGAGTKVLGPVYIGDNARIGAGSVVLKNLPANCTAVGVPAAVVRINNKAVNPADDLDQQDLPDMVAQRITDLDRRISAMEKAAQGDVPPTIHDIRKRSPK